MIKELKILIDKSENDLRTKKIFLKIAEFPEDKQKDTLELLKFIIKEVKDVDLK